VVKTLRKLNCEIGYDLTVIVKRKLPLLWVNNDTRWDHNGFRFINQLIILYYAKQGGSGI